MAYEFHSGKDGTVLVGSTELAVTGWDVDPTTDGQEFINSKTGQYPDYEATFKRLTGTVRLDFDYSENPFAAPIALDVGAVLTGMKLFLNGTAGLYWHVPNATVTSTPQSLERAGRVETSFAFRAKGQWGRPGSPVP